MFYAISTFLSFVHFKNARPLIEFPIVTDSICVLSNASSPIVISVKSNEPDNYVPAKAESAILVRFELNLNSDKFEQFLKQLEYTYNVFSNSVTDFRFLHPLKDL